MNNINKLMEEYFEVNDSIKELESKRDRIKAEIKLFMSENNEEKYKYNGNMISYRFQVRRSLDRNLLLNYISRVKLDKCYKESEFRVLKVISKESLEKMRKFIKD